MSCCSPAPRLSTAEVGGENERGLGTGWFARVRAARQHDTELHPTRTLTTTARITGTMWRLFIVRRSIMKHLGQTRRSVPTSKEGETAP